MTETKTAETVKADSVIASKNKPPARSSFRFMLTLFNLCLVVGLAGLAFLYWEQQKSLVVLFDDYNSAGQQQAETATRFTAEAAARASMQEAMNMQLAAAAEQLATQAQQLEVASREIRSLRLRIGEQSSGANQSWKLTEAESLLRLARQRLLSARDVRSAISLYLACDDLLQQINDPTVIAVREVLLTELDSLRAVVIPDQQAIYERLGNLAAQLDELSLTSDSSSREFSFPVPETEAATESAGWLSELGNSLSQYFVITRQDNPQLPQISAEQAYMTRQIIQLHLEAARVALLREQTRLYQTALNAAIGDIQLYLQGAGKEQVLSSLAQLRDMPVLAVLPPTGSTLNALRQIAPDVAINNEGLVQ